MNFDQNNYLKTNEKMNTKKGHKKKNLIIVWTYSYWFEVIVTSKWLFIECSWDLWLMLCCVVRWPFRKIELMASPAGSPSRGQPSLVRPHLKSHLLPEAAHIWWLINAEYNDQVPGPHVRIAFKGHPSSRSPEGLSWESENHRSVDSFAQSLFLMLLAESVSA